MSTNLILSKTKTRFAIFAIINSCHFIYLFICHHITHFLKCKKYKIMIYGNQKLLDIDLCIYESIYVIFLLQITNMNKISIIIYSFINQKINY